MTGPSAPRPSKPRRPAIDIVSPLPPVRSGVSDYTVDLLPELAARSELRIVRVPEQPIDESILGGLPTVETVDVLKAGPDAPVLLYQMGNNHHHWGVWRIASERPGVLVLHDFVLHHFLIDRTVKAEDDHPAYRDVLEACHGWIGATVAMPLRWPGGSGLAAQFALPAHRSLLANQKGVLVHSQWAADRLLESMPELRVRVLPMGVPLPRRADADAGRAFRNRHGIPVDAPVLGSFGFQTPIKRTDVALRVLARMPDLHLMVAGEPAPHYELDVMAREAGVGDRVHVLGFLPFDDFEDAIAACDVALNLRYPTAGETSASLLRILAVGRPAIVSDHAQMADLPGEIVAHIPLGDGEARALEARLRGWLAAPDRLRALGERARRHVAEHHRPADAAAAVVEACADWADLDPPGVASPIPAAAVPPPTTLAWDELPGVLEVEGADRPWPAGERRRLRIRLGNRSEAVWLAGERLGGGVAIQPKLIVDGVDQWADRPWIGLPIDLPPGRDHVFELTFRRPLDASVRLEVLPHVLDHTSLAALGGPSWSAEL